VDVLKSITNYESPEKEQSPDSCLLAGTVFRGLKVHKNFEIPGIVGRAPLFSTINSM